MRDLDWKNVHLESLKGKDYDVVKEFMDARAALEEYIQAKQGPCVFSYKKGGIAFAKQNGTGRTVSSF